jgi:hypothetical protein
LQLVHRLSPCATVVPNAVQPAPAPLPLLQPHVSITQFWPSMW